MVLKYIFCKLSLIISNFDISPTVMYTTIILDAVMMISHSTENIFHWWLSNGVLVLSSKLMVI